MDQVSEDEKERLLKEFQQKQERKYRTGEIIVTAIVVINIIVSIFNSLTKGNFISLLINVALSIALYRGVTWVRYFFAIGAAFGSFLMLAAIMDGSSYINMVGGKIVLIVIVLLSFMYSIFSAIVLFKSESVSEFLYKQKNG